MILIDALALTNGHSSRGIGHYARRLLESLALASQARPVPMTALVADSTVQHHMTSALTWRPARPRTRLTWAINRVLCPLDFVRAGKVDLFHATDPNGLCRPRNVPLLATAHDLIPLRFPASYWDPMSFDERVGYRRMLSAYRRAEHIVAVSHATRAEFIEMLGIEQSRISVVYPGIRTSNAFLPTDKPVSPSIPERYFLYVGALDERKNLKDVLTSYAAIADDIPEDFVFAGKIDPRERAGVARHIARLNIGSRVHWLDYVAAPILNWLYAHASALIFMSRYEGFGLPVLEAMAKDCPVICSDAGALKEVAGDACEVVALDNDRALASAMTLLSTNPARRRQLIAAGRERSQAFDLPGAGQQMLDLYERAFGIKSDLKGVAN